MYMYALVYVNMYLFLVCCSFCVLPVVLTDLFCFLLQALISSHLFFHNLFLVDYYVLPCKNMFVICFYMLNIAVCLSTFYLFLFTFIL